MGPQKELPGLNQVIHRVTQITDFPDHRQGEIPDVRNGVTAIRGATLLRKFQKYLVVLSGVIRHDVFFLVCRDYVEILI